MTGDTEDLWYEYEQVCGASGNPLNGSEAFKGLC